MKIISLFILTLLLSACDPSRVVNNLRDEKTTKGCKVINGNIRGNYTNTNADFCGVYCYDKLPDNMVYEYDDGRGCKITIQGDKSGGGI